MSLQGLESPERYSGDDLEKELLIAAADADARNESEYAKRYECVNYFVENNESYTENDVQNDSGNSSKTPDTDYEVPAKVPRFVKETGGYANVVATHYNKLEEKGLDERSKSRIFYMRNFHNWIKSMLINEYLTKIKDGKKYSEPIRVSDMCCGKGGDLLKWRKGGITHLICSDIANISVDQCKSRYNDMKNRREKGNSNIYSIEYIVADCSNDRLREKYRDPSMKLDLVSCQFAFHYSFESLPQAECMMRNAAECLQPGGYFIGTIPDANELIARAHKSGRNQFGNDVYQVEFYCDTHKPPLFGGKYNFRLHGVVDCPEFLVHFPTLVKLAKKYGLKLVRKEKFYEYYERMKFEGRNLLSNMNSLETYPPQDGTTLVGTNYDYKHADEFLKTQDSPNAKVGTLSKSEWEASCKSFISFIFYLTNV